ncbi:substrate-binding domain-containing protein [Clavibacter michiganensis]|uniref:substrate-binding domain-containing protein n=1 Tax=Clavibacter michiganensis TaxID=28447 RepID=UPI003EBB9494
MVWRPTPAPCRDGSTANRPRYAEEAFGDGCAARGMEVRRIPAGDWTERSGAASIERTELRTATAVFAANDAMDIGALDALARAGVRVPEDIAVLGADDIPAAAFVTPSLSSVAHDLDEQGRHAARTLLRTLREDPAPISDPTFGVSIRRRATTTARGR